MIDTFEGFAPGLESPATRLKSVVPNDSVDLDHASRALNAAGAGLVRVTTLGGDTETLFLAAGIAFPLRVSRIWQTGTTATGIVVLY
jgi:hypothetical protein